MADNYNPDTHIPANLVNEQPSVSEVDSDAPCNAFGVRDRVWAMRHNKPQKGIVFGVLLTPEYGAVGEVVATYLVWFSNSLCSVSEEGCIRIKEGDLAKSKEELLRGLE